MKKDRVTIHSGTENGCTLGTPILLTVSNEISGPRATATRSSTSTRATATPIGPTSKYGIKASSGGGRSSTRETIGRVAAGAVAEKLLREAYGVEIVAFVSSVGNIKLFSDTDAMSVDPVFLSLAETLTRSDVDKFLPVRCPHEETSRRMEQLTTELKEQEDSTGSSVTCIIRNAPAGLGEPCFDKLEAKLSHAMLSIPAVKGFEIGSGFLGAEMNSSKHNDPFSSAPEQAVSAAEHKLGIPRSRLVTKTNHSGGIQGGIFNGMPIFLRVAFKPPATIGQDQTSTTPAGRASSPQRAAVTRTWHLGRSLVEAMAALVIADAVMAQHARQASIQMGKSS